MIGNFEILKKQLIELAKVVNSFKSEAVQLKVTELVLTGQVVQTPVEEETTGVEGATGSQKGIKKTKKKAKKAKKAKKTSKRRSSKVGPATILTELIDDGYFKQAHKIGDIIEHVAHNKARKFKANDLSSPLTRFVRDGRLKRNKNKDGQYEYKKT